MIERKINMSTKKEYTIEELEAQYKLAEEKRNALKQQIEQKKKEEEELREAKLVLEKDTRKKEVDEALEKYKKLLKAYIDDYGIYSCTTDGDAFDLFNTKFWNLII
jgi:glucose-6-phosphate isomerase